MKVDLTHIQYILHADADLRTDFYRITNDCRDAACIVDIWMHDLAWVFKKHGYALTIEKEANHET